MNGEGQASPWSGVLKGALGLVSNLLGIFFQRRAAKKAEKRALVFEQRMAALRAALAESERKFAERMAERKARWAWADEMARRKIALERAKREREKALGVKPFDWL